MVSKFYPLSVQFYIILLIVAALLNVVFGDKKESKVDVPLKQQIKSVYQDEKMKSCGC